MQERRVDFKQNTVQYHVTNSNMEAWIVDDLNSVRLFVSVYYN